MIYFKTHFALNAKDFLTDPLPRSITRKIVPAVCSWQPRYDCHTVFFSPLHIFTSTIRLVCRPVPKLMRMRIMTVNLNTVINTASVVFGYVPTHCDYFETI